MVQVLLDVQLWFPVWLVFLTGLGFDLSLIGAVDGAFRVTVVIMELPCGRLVDRIGGRRSLMAVGVATAAVHLGIATIGSTTHLVSAWLAWGVLWALASGVAPAYLSLLLDRHAPWADRPTVFGQARAASSFVVLVSHLAAGALLAVQPRGPFIVTALLGGVAAVIAHGLPRDPVGANTAASFGVRALARTMGDRPDLRRAITTGALVLTLGWSVRILFQPLMLEQALTPTWIGVAYLAYSGMAVVGGLAAGRLARQSVGRGIATCTAIAWFGILATAIQPTLGPWLTIPLVGFGFHAAWALVEVQVTALSPPLARATMLSVVSMAAGVAIAVARPALAIVAGRWDATVAYAAWAVAGVAILSVVVPLATRYRYSEGSVDEAAS